VSVPSVPPPPPPRAGGPLGGAAVATPTSERIETLDVLRGFALLGILLVNIELFRGPTFYDVVLGRPPTWTGVDAVTSFLVGWLVYGKFISSFAILFGLGAAMIAGRVAARGRSPRPLLARRYAWLMAFGLAHMVLLFPGDVLLLYGVTGLAQLAFVTVRPRVALGWAAGLLGVALLVTLGLTAAGTVGAAADDPFEASFAALLEDRRDTAVDAYQVGGPLDRVGVRASESLLIQSTQLLLLPWTLALFLFGYAVWRSGVLVEPGRRRRAFRRATLIAVPVGLLLNLPLGLVGPLGDAAGATSADRTIGLLAAAAQVVGAPVLAVGYLAGLAWWCERPAVLAALGPLRDAGRMALTGYLLQSLLAAVAFGWFRLYGRLEPTSALLVVAGIWAVVLAVSSVVMRRFERGPVEHLWRLGTYGRPGR
jgi:uncharacterized protein